MRGIATILDYISPAAIALYILGANVLAFVIARSALKSCREDKPDYRFHYSIVEMLGGMLGAAPYAALAANFYSVEPDPLFLCFLAALLIPHYIATLMIVLPFIQPIHAPPVLHPPIIAISLQMGWFVMILSLLLWIPALTILGIAYIVKWIDRRINKPQS